MILALYGSPASGKSSLALKLAKEFIKKKKQVIVVHTDYYAPAFVTFFPSVEEKGSLGRLLSLPEISQEAILKELNTVKQEDSLAILSYKREENKYLYPEYTKDRAMALLIQLKYMADIVIIDCQTAFYEDLFSITAIEMADKTFCVIESSLKGLSYYKSCMPLLNETRFSTSKHIKIVQDTQNTGLEDVVSESLSGAGIIFPYVEELKEQFKKETILKNLGNKGKIYEKLIKQLVESIGKD